VKSALESLARTFSTRYLKFRERSKNTLRNFFVAILDSTVNLSLARISFELVIPALGVLFLMNSSIFEMLTTLLFKKREEI
jgi:hypothetical protein